MKLHKVVCVLITAACITSISQKAFSWGSYAHQQINYAAVELLKENAEETSLAYCLDKNKDLLQRLAISPDFDWKIVGSPITDPKLAKKRKWANGFEHPLHFFEVDAFSNDPSEVSHLPSGEFSLVFEKYA